MSVAILQDAWLAKWPTRVDDNSPDMSD